MNVAQDQIILAISFAIYTAGISLIIYTTTNAVCMLWKAVMGDKR